jgi:hypothetical protein
MRIIDMIPMTRIGHIVKNIEHITPTTASQKTFLKRVNAPPTMAITPDANSPPPKLAEDSANGTPANIPKLPEKRLIISATMAVIPAIIIRIPAVVGFHVLGKVLDGSEGFEAG